MRGGFDVFQADLGEGGHVGQLRQAGRVGHGQRADLAAVDEAGAGCQVDHHRGDLAARHVSQRGRCATVRHVGHGQAAFDFQQFHGQVVRAARTGGTVVQAFLARFGLGQEFLHGVDLHGRAHHQNHGKAAHQRDGRQVLDGVIRQLLVQRGVEHQRAVVGGQHGVAVSRRARGFGCRDGGVAARLVLDHNRLAQATRQALADAARQKVGPATRRIGHHPAHGLGRVVGGRLLGESVGTGQQGQGQQAGQESAFQGAIRGAHRLSPFWDDLMASLLLRKSYTQCVIFQEGLTLEPISRRVVVRAPYLQEVHPL
ncbi:hypothetical protein D3C72_1210980 [compost metagenome]